MAPQGRWRQALQRWADSDDQHVRDLREAHASDEVIPIAEVQDRAHVVLGGVLRTVTLRPRGGVPALEADLDDGTGTITVVWLGRRRIAGVEPGRNVRVEGRVAVHGGVRTIFNPRYELRP